MAGVGVGGCRRLYEKVEMEVEVEVEANEEKGRGSSYQSRYYYRVRD